MREHKAELVAVVEEGKKMEKNEQIIKTTPQSLNEFIGQDRVRENLSIAIEAAKKRNEPLDHILLCGSQGLGKTTMARIIAHEMNADIKAISCNDVKNESAMRGILSNMNAGDILLLSDIQMINQSVCDSLIEAMTNFSFQIILGKENKFITVDLAHFTIICETEKFSLSPRELQNCFGIVEYFEAYTGEQLKMMIKRWVAQLQILIGDDEANELATNCNGMPSTARRMLKKTRDYAEVLNNGIVSREIVEKVVEQERDLGR